MIRWLLNHLLFAGTFFAAAAAPVVAGGGASSAGGAGSGGDGAGSGGGTGGDKAGTGGDGGRAIPGADKGGASGADKAITEGHLGGGTEEFGDLGDFDTEDVELSDAGTGSTEEFGPETYQTIKQALKDKPEIFKSVKKAVSLVKRYQEHIESPEALGELLTDMQTFGGWDQVKADMGETATFLNGWNAGDAEVVKAWIKENGDGLSKNMPTVLDAWRAADPEGWAYDAALTFMATLNHAPVGGISALAALNALGQKEGIADSPEYKRLVEVIKGIQQRTNQAPERRAKTPDEGKLSEREQKIRQGEWEVTRGRLSQQATPVLSKEATNALKLVAGGRKLSEQSRSALVSDIHAEFARVVNKMDPGGKDKRQKLLAAGQSEQWLKLVKSAAARFMPIAARNVWRKYAGISGLSTQQKEQRRAEGGQRREAGSASAAGGGMEKKSPGDGRQVDKAAMIAKFGSRDKAEDAFLWGIKESGGKRVWIEKGTGTLYTY
jgi:hypothetical protein